MRRRINAVLLFVLVLTLVAACSKKSDPPASSSGGGSSGGGGGGSSSPPSGGSSSAPSGNTYDGNWRVISQFSSQPWNPQPGTYYTITGNVTVSNGNFSYTGTANNVCLGSCKSDLSVTVTGTILPSGEFTIIIAQGLWSDTGFTGTCQSAGSCVAANSLTVMIALTRV